MANKTATKNKEAEFSLDDRRSAVRTALRDRFNPGNDNMGGPWIVEQFDTNVIYELGDNELFKINYSFGDDGVVTLIGEPVKVKRKVTFNPIEALQNKYSAVISEAGKRNAGNDSGRIRQIITLCNELLSSEKPSREAIDEAMGACDALLPWLTTLEAVKDENGAKYPAGAYAYTPDLNDPATWKLRIWETVSAMATAAQLQRASVALSPGGFDGKPSGIPSADIPDVQRRIRAAYRGLDIKENDIPKWVKDGAEMREVISGYIPLSEAAYENGVAMVTVIKHGFNIGKGHHYSEAMLARDYGIFEGVKMFADHETKDEEDQRPERSIKDWVATLQNVRINEQGNVVGDATIVEPWLQIKLATLRDKNLLGEMGVSINAIGSATKATIEGVKTNSVERLIRARSVDFVTAAGAGGGVELYEAAEGDNILDVDLITLSDLRERRADLVEDIETAVISKYSEGVKRQMDDKERITQLESENVTLASERDKAVTKLVEVTSAGEKAIAQAAIITAINSADLHQAAKDRLLEAHSEDVSSEGIAEAIQDEADYLAKITETNKVKDLGPVGDDKVATAKVLREGFKILNPEWTEAQLDTACRGR